MGLSIWQIVLVVLVFLLLFGRGKIPALMSDMAQGIKSFKAGMKDDAPEKQTNLAEKTQENTKEEIKLENTAEQTVHFDKASDKEKPQV